MATMYERNRTNYFRVTDPSKYEELVKGLYGTDTGGQIDFWKRKDSDGTIRYGFGAYEGIGYDDSPENEEKDSDIDRFLKRMAELLPEGEVFLLMEVGYEKLCYLFAGCYYAMNCSDGYKTGYMNFETMIKKNIGIMLDDPDFDTEMEY